MKYLLVVLTILLVGVVYYVFMSQLLQFTANRVPAKEDNLVTKAIKEIVPNIVYTSNIDINYLRSLTIDSEKPVIEKELADGSNYKQYIASYISEGNKIYGLLTIPKGDMPSSGFSAIVFCHGYIPPSQYVTTQKYVEYVDYLAKNGFVVFKIDFRGNGESQGNANGSYFSPGYTIDAISALKSLQKDDRINAEKIGIWGHSMSGNVVMHSLLVSNNFKAAVIWAGAVYSYKDFAKYRINDNSYAQRPFGSPQNRENQNLEQVLKFREDPSQIDFNDSFWKSVSLTENINYLSTPLQINHAITDPVVNIGYSRDLVQVLKNNNKTYEFYEYKSGGHNIESPYFEEAMKNTIDFFNKYLK